MDEQKRSRIYEINKGEMEDDPLSTSVVAWTFAKRSGRLFGLFPKAWRRVFQRRWGRDGWCDGFDGFRGVMDLVGFPLKINMF